MPAIREPLTNEDLWDWDRMTTALAATEAWWQPGTRHAYHTNTYGHLVGELIRRTTGEMPGTRLRAMADSLGADCAWGPPLRTGAMRRRDLGLRARARGDTDGRAHRTIP